MRWLVGTYAETIADIALDAEQGRLEMVRSHDCEANPSFLALHPRLPAVYAVHELRTWQGVFGGAAGAYALQQDGVLPLLGTVATHGVDPCHLAVDSSGSWLDVWSRDEVVRVDLKR